MKNNWQKVYPNQWGRAKQVLKRGGVIVAPTDTLYGILACAFDKKAVEKVYKIKGRDEGKPFIILITNIKDLNKFGVKHSNILQNIGMFKGKKISMILPCENKKFAYLHRGKKSLAFRVVSKRNKNLCKLINEVGPLVAPSANPQGLTPAKTIKQARDYFGTKVDLYINAGVKDSKPSTIISFLEKEPKILRK